MTGRTSAGVVETGPDGRHAHEHAHVHDHPGEPGHHHPGEPGHDHPGEPGHDDAHGNPDGAPDATTTSLGRILVDHLHHVYPDGTEALRGIDLRVEPGEKVALVGPNGAGKSTLLLHLNGILEPTHGEIHVDSVRVERATLKQVRARVGLVFQDPDDQLFSPTVGEDVAFGPVHMGVPHDELHGRVERALASVGMSGMERRVPHHLSLGQRKRVSLATVLAMDPTVLVFDEPTAGLDPRGRRELMRLMVGRPETLLVSTHDMAMVAEVFERVVLIDDGLIVADDATGSVLADEPLLLAHGLERP